MEQKTVRVIIAAIVGAVVWAAFGAVILDDQQWFGAICGSLFGASVGAVAMLKPQVTIDGKKAVTTVATGTMLSIIFAMLLVIIILAMMWFTETQ